MKAKTLQIHWHDKQPIFAVDFEPIAPGRLATCGADSNVRLWAITKENPPKIEFLSNLSRHSASVNCVRWSPKGAILASAGDDGAIILWQQTELEKSNLLDDGDDFNRETWKIATLIRGCGSDIYDLAWSPDATMIVSGLIDNTVRIWDVKTGKCLQVLTHHTHFVQGVTWDPLGKYIASQSCDRSVMIYSYETNKTGAFQAKLISKVTKMETNTKDKFVHPPSPSPSASSHTQTNSTELMPPPPPSPKRTHITHPISPSLPPGSPSLNANSPRSQKSKLVKMYHDENLTSFFRRLAFLPDGSMLLTPASQTRARNEEDMVNTVYVYSRGRITGDPVKHLPAHKRPSIAVRACPVPFLLRKQEDEESATTLVKLPYRLVYAVATQDSVYIYDTQHSRPIALLGNLHYSTFTDLAWSEDGNNLVLSSTDGYCSIVSFDEGELGIPLPPDQIPKSMRRVADAGEKEVKETGRQVVNEVTIKRKNAEVKEEESKKIKT